MSGWLIRAPYWALAVAVGAVLFPVVLLADRLALGQSWPAAVVSALVLAALCGPVVGLVAARQIRDSLAAAGSLDADGLVRVERAARRGPVPEDDDVRAAALRVAEDRLLVFRGVRTRALTSSVVVMLIGVLLAVVRSPAWWVLAAAGLVSVALGLLGPVRLQRRARLLRAAGGEAPASDH